MTRRPHANLELIKSALGDSYLELAINRVRLDQTVDDSDLCKVEIDIHDGLSASTVKGRGCGLVDAIWSGLLARYASEYNSLKSIELASFAVQARIDTKKHHEGTDAIGEVTLEVRNSDGARFAFSDASRSIVSSTARAVLAGIEYFVNAERAFIMLFKSRQDARERNRSDLVTRYTAELAEVVKSTSYAEVLENMKKEI